MIQFLLLNKPFWKTAIFSNSINFSMSSVKEKMRWGY